MKLTSGANVSTEREEEEGAREEVGLLVSLLAQPVLGDTFLLPPSKTGEREGGGITEISHRPTAKVAN